MSKCEVKAHRVPPHGNPEEPKPPPTTTTPTTTTQKNKLALIRNVLAKRVQIRASGVSQKKSDGELCAST